MQAWERWQTLRRERLDTYTAYSIGCAVVWALIWAKLAVSSTAETRKRILLVSSGWWQGWLSATIARVVYPAPKKRLLRRD